MWEAEGQPASHWHDDLGLLLLCAHASTDVAEQFNIEAPIRGERSVGMVSLAAGVIGSVAVPRASEAHIRGRERNCSLACARRPYSATPSPRDLPTVLTTKRREAQ